MKNKIISTQQHLLNSHKSVASKIYFFQQRPLKSGSHFSIMTLLTEFSTNLPGHIFHPFRQQSFSITESVGAAGSSSQTLPHPL